MSNDDTCRSCQAPIVWAVSEAGNPIPIDPTPQDGGNLILEERTRQDGRGTYTVARLRDPLFDSSTCHVSHFVTCPNAAHRRGKKR